MSTSNMSVQSADLILVGGTVHTFDEHGTTASALAIADGIIIAAGTNAEILRHADTDTVVHDLEGATAIPGINDSHLHATWLGATWPNVMLSDLGMSGQLEVSRLVTAEERHNTILRANRIVSSFGITSYTEPGLGPGEDDGPTGCFSTAVLDTYRELAETRQLTARVTALMLYGLLDGPTDPDEFKRGVESVTASDQQEVGPRQPIPNWLHVNGIKIFADGIPPMRTAWTSRHYDDGTNGELLIDGDDPAQRAENLHAMIRFAHDRHLQVGVHATGDLSIEALITAVAHDPADAIACRHYVVHGDLVTASQLEQLGKLGMGINMQPALVTPMSDLLRQVLESAATAPWPFVNALRAGATVCLSSDGPITTPDWRLAIARAAELMTISGHVTTSQSTMPELLRAYTTTPAYQDGAEHWKGTLEPGKVADICVLGEDPLTIEPSRLPAVAIAATICGGRLVYDGQQEFNDDLVPQL